MELGLKRFRTYAELRDAGESALKSGRLRYKPGHGGYVECTFCWRHGGFATPWMEDCMFGHPYVCACGRVYANKQAIAAHRRASRVDAPGHTHRYTPTGARKNVETIQAEVTSNES